MAKKFLVLFLGVAALSGLFWYSRAKNPVCRKNCPAKIFVIAKSEGLGSVAQRLEKEGLIRSSFYFQLEATRLSIGRKIQAGDFRLNAGMTPTEIAGSLTHGVLDRWVTFIEGWRREEMADELLKEGFANFEKEEFLLKTKDQEGKLFPDTYLFPKELNADTIIRFMTGNFEKKTAGLDLTKEDLIIASILEREVKSEADRPIVAGILKKRLSNSWPLQVDATVQYALGSARCQKGEASCEWWPKDLTKDDLGTDSPYNTYLYQGLPPAPICNPGLNSIKAAKNPVATEYWYYLSDRQGKLHFAKTLEEHQQNITRYLRQEEEGG